MTGQEITTSEELAREINYRREERLGILYGSIQPPQAAINEADRQTREWAKAHYPELYNQLTR